jgi:hypothetical protein
MDLVGLGVERAAGQRARALGVEREMVQRDAQLSAGDFLLEARVHVHAAGAAVRRVRVLDDALVGDHRAEVSEPVVLQPVQAEEIGRVAHGPRRRALESEQAVAAADRGNLLTEGCLRG